MSIEDKIDKFLDAIPDGDIKNAVREVKWEINGHQRACALLGEMAKLLHTGTDFPPDRVACSRLDSTDGWDEKSFVAHFYPYIGGHSTDMLVHVDDVDDICKELQETKEWVLETYK